jgi:tetratricopeptide (TPR) repeat protein
MNLKNVKKATAPPKPVKPEISRAPSFRIYYLLIIAFSFVLYGNTISNRYAIDDFYVTANNPLVQQGIKAIPAIFTSYYINISAEEGGQHNYGYRPIAKATFAIEWQIFRENPYVSHFMNILLYALTGLLLFQLLRKLLKHHHVLFPFLTVMLFLAHPLHTEVVASLKNREELLSFLGALLALKYFLKFHETGKKPNLLWATLSLVLGFLSKANIVTFLFIIPLTFYFFTDIKPKKIILLTTAMLAILIITALLPRLFLGTSTRPIQFIENPLYFGVGPELRIGTSMMALLFYLKMLIFPHPLVFYYGFNMIPVSGMGNPLVWVSMLLHLGLLGFAIWKIRQKHILSFAVLFYLVSISPFANLITTPTGIVAERFLYVASLGFCLAMVYGLFRLFGSEPANPKMNRKAVNYVLLASALIAIPATAKTIDRNNDWRDELTLYAADMPYLEHSAKANFIYATNLRSSVIDRLKSGVPRNQVKPDALICIKHFKRATAVYPEYPDAWNNLGEVFLLVLNEPDSAIQYFEKATVTNPEFTAAFYNLGYTYQVTDQDEKAIPNYEKALELEPYEIRAMSNLAKLYQKTGQTEKAIQLNEDIILIEPGLDLPYINLGTYAMRNGEPEKALEYFAKAIELNPNNFELNMKLRNYYQKVGDSTKADYYLDLARRSGRPVQ